MAWWPPPPSTTVPPSLALPPSTIELPLSAPDASAPPASLAPPSLVATHAPATHAVPVPHVRHALPALPHALLAAPPRQAPAEQHPAHEVPSHAHAPEAQWRPDPHVPLVQVPPHPSLPPHATPVQSGVHPHVPGLPFAPHVRPAVQALPAQHICPFPPHAPQLALPHATPDAHALHTTPPVPHALATLPGSHVARSQHPLHDVPSHVHTPVTQCWPLPHVPSWHTPPHESLAPHALPAQSGLQPHTFAVPPPPHDSGNAHVEPEQHACPLPPHVPQSTPHALPAAHAVHAAPPMPQALCESPLAHVLPSQHPAHDVPSHVQTPSEHRSPCPHAPSVHTPSHPLLAPHALPAHDGVHAPVPHTLGIPPPPQSWPMLHPPQSTSFWHASNICPHLPMHVADKGGHPASAPDSTDASIAVASSPASDGPGLLPLLNEPQAATARQATSKRKGKDFTTPGGHTLACGRMPPEPPLEAALAALRGEPDVRYAEARLVDETSERLAVRDGRPEQVTGETSRGVGIRVLGGKTWGFACTADTSEAALLAAARRALRVARASSTVARFAVVFPERPAQRGTYATRLSVDPFTVPLEAKLAALDAPERALRTGDPRLRSAEAWMSWTRQRKRLLTTEGTDVAQTFTFGTCGMHVFTLGDDGVSQRRSFPTYRGTDGFQGGYEHVARVDLPGAVEQVKDEALALLTAPPCPAGTRTVLLESSQVALQIHESCGHPAELDRALGSEISLAGGSFLQPPMLGKLTYGSALVTLVADATSEGGNGTFGWDDEGVPAGRHVLVDRGLFVDYLSSRETAAALGRSSTGTMRAEAWNRPPIIRMVNVSLDPGDAGTLEDLVADTDDGLLVATDRSWSIDDLRLNFQFSCEAAWEIRHGRRTRILRDPLYTGITPRFWGSCDAVCGPEAWRLWGITDCGKGDPMQLMQVGHGASPARFRDVTVGSEP